jgi:predicted aspartyl protease
MRFTLNTDVVPPAPIVTLSVSRPDDPSNTVDAIPALVDSGADFTVLPARLVGPLRLEQSGFRRLLGFGGRIVECPTYLVRIQITGMLQRFLVSVPCDSTEPMALLGRDILSQYRVVIDGPRGFVELGT